MAKYIAAGFFNDAEKLLNEFVHENSFDFSVFAQVWTKHNFATVYLGRDKYQVTVFTNEIFQITLGFLQNSIFLYQVGAIYLLYALYRHQICIPFIMIRLTFSQYEIFKKVQTAARENHFHTLLYVTEYLYQNALDFVAFSTLYGPTAPRARIDYNNRTIVSSSMLNDIKSEMTKFQNSKVLEDLRDLNKRYSSLREQVYSQQVKSTISDYEEHIKRLDSLISDGPLSFSKCKDSTSKVESSIGSHRAALKAAAFSNSTFFQEFSGADSEPEEPKTLFATRARRKWKFPNGNRRIEHPKNSSIAEPLMNSAPANENFSSEMELPKVSTRRGPWKRMTFLDDCNLVPELSSIRSQSVYPGLQEELKTEEEDNSEEIDGNYDSEENFL